MDLMIKLESEATVKRYFDNLDRVRATQGWGHGDDAIAITEAYVADVVATIPDCIDRARRSTGKLKALVPLLIQLDPKVIAVCGLQGLLHCIGIHYNWSATIRLLGRSLESECFGAGLTRHDRRKAKMVTQEARQRYSRVDARIGFAKRRAGKPTKKDPGYRVPLWTPARRAVAGGWLLDLVLAALPHVFHQEGKLDDKVITLLPEAVKLAEDAIAGLLEKHPVFFPMLDTPLPWTDFTGGGPRDQRELNKVAMLRTGYTRTKGRVKEAIRSGAMRPTLDALNALQAVPWRINTRVLKVLKDAYALGIEVDGLPAKRLDKPKEPADFDALTPEEQRSYIVETLRVQKHNQKCTSNRIGLQMDLATAELFKDAERFYTPMNLDFRGRVYPMTSFHFQRDDRVRALFLFADGEPIGEDGLRWLKIHCANCAAMSTPGGKSDKLPMGARVAWVDQNLDRIRAVTQGPLQNLWWTEADNPFLFLAAAFELMAAMEAGPSFVCHLPVSFDGSCSGLQHLCAMTRDPKGALVNLTPSPVPADIYAVVAERVRARLQADAVSSTWPEGEEWRGEVARLALAHGVDRKTVKRGVMTYSYSSKKHGMAAQLQTDLMGKLQDQVNEGKLAVHPFAPYHHGSLDIPGKASRHLASHIFECIEELISLPAEAMRYLQKIARALAHEGEPASWVTPAGLPWINRYHEPIIETVTLWMYDRGVRVRMNTNVAEGHEDHIQKEKSANAIAPNFVHALDASHLLLTVVAAVDEGITGLATVHDSFGCLPSRAGRFNQIIREQFVRMYQDHDVLAEVLAQAKCVLTVTNHRRLPSPVERGDLDITGVLDADFAFA